MAKFKCKLSGCVVEFQWQHDIDDMRRHPEYDEVLDEVKSVKKVKNEIDTNSNPIN